MEHLRPAEGSSFCEWKGQARYYDVVVNEQAEEKAAWYYPDAVPDYADLKEYVAFYPSKMDGC
jgi:uncharacterized protein (DUF427 family)